jgi:N-acetylglutamate synthase-like GNAT family acetyltransferase
MEEHRIEVLAGRPELIETVARWHWQEWGHLTPTLSLTDRVEGLHGQADETWLVLEGDEPLGAATLVEHDMDTHPDLGPWIAGVYVRADRRGEGIGRTLNRQVAAVAAARGARTLYLYTDEAQEYWEHLGWYRIAEEPYLGETVTVMALDLS